MSFQDLTAKEQDELLKAINNQSPRRVINKFDGQVREEGLKILVLLSMEGSISLNQSIIFSQTSPKITRANYNNKLDEAEIILSDWVNRNPTDDNAKKILDEVRSGG